MPNRITNPLLSQSIASLAKPISLYEPQANSVTAVAGNTLSWHIERVVRDYLHTLGDNDPNDLYEIMLLQLEKPLLSVVLEHTRGNQTRTADILGLNRGTLRKKMKIHDLM